MWPTAEAGEREIALVGLRRLVKGGWSVWCQCRQGGREGGAGESPKTKGGRGGKIKR